MKILLATISAWFFPLIANAGGQFTITNSFLGKEWRHAPMLGLSIDQHLFGNYHLTSWAGLGSRPDLGDSIKHWGGMKVGIDYRYRFLVLGAGFVQNVQVDDWLTLQALDGKTPEQGGYVRLGYKLW